MGRRVRPTVDSEKDFSEPSRSAKSDSPIARRSASRQRSRRRLIWIGGLFLFMPVIAVALLPQALHFTSVRDAMLLWAAPHLAPHVTFEAFEGGWLIPVAVRKLRITDRDQQELARIERIDTQRNLVGWLMQGLQDLPEIVCLQPTFQIRVAPDGTTNAQRMLELLPGPTTGAQTEDSSQATPILRLAIRQGALQLTQAQGAIVDLQALDIDVETAAQWSDWRVRLTGTSNGLHPNQAAGKLAIYLNQASNSPKDSSVATDNLPLGDTEATRSISLSVDQLAWRWWIDDNTVIPGRLDAQVTSRWDMAHSQPTQTSVECNIDSAWGKILAKAALPWDAWQATLLHFDMAKLGEVAAQPGDLQITAQIPLESWANLPALRADFAETQLEGAELKLTLVSALSGERAEERKFELQTEIGPGRIVHATTPFAWQQPMTLDALAASQQGNLFIRSLSCQTPFLAAQGSGSAESLEGKFKANLAQLATHFRSFLPSSVPHLEGELSGNIRGNVALAHDGSRTWKTEASVNGTDFRWTWVPERVWQEPQWEWKGTVIAKQANSAWQIEQLESQMLLDGGDELHVKLLAPLALTNLGGGRLDAASATSDAPLAAVEILATDWSQWEMALAGEAARWQARSAPFVDWGPIEARGAATLTARLAPTHTGLVISSGNLDWKKCHVSGPDWSWQEPLVQLAVQGNGQWSPSYKFDWEDIALTSTALALRTRDGEIAWQPDLQTAGLVKFRGHIKRIVEWSGHPAPSLPDQWGELVDGELEWSTDQEGPRWKLRANSNHRPAATGQPSEPPLQVVAQGRLQGTGMVFRVDEVEARVPGLQLAAATKIIESPAAPKRMNLQGTSDYVLEQLVPISLTRAWGLTEVHGQQRAAFELELPWDGVSGATNGPNMVPVSSSQRDSPVSSTMSSTAASTVSSTRGSDSGTMTAVWTTMARGHFEAGWDSARLLDLPVGPGKIQVKLMEGQVQFAPIAAQIGEGQLSLRPTIDLRGVEPTAYLQDPAKLDRLHLTPEICRGYLKYIAPLVADVANSRGVFTVAIDGMRLPAYHADLMQVSGKLTIHEASIGPGPLTQQVLQGVQLVQSLAKGSLLKGGGLGSEESTPDGHVWLNIPAQSIPWSVRDGRVYHEGMMVQIGDVVLKSRGWVAFDEAMQLVVEVPVQPGWVESRPWLKSLAGTSIQLPVSGTLRRPQVNQSGLAQLGNQSVQGAVQGAVEERLKQEVQKQLFKLFDK